MNIMMNRKLILLLLSPWLSHRSAVRNRRSLGSGKER
jgi:hypothetical protein